MQAADTRRSGRDCAVGVQSVLPMRAGQLERRTPDYKRHGVERWFGLLTQRQIKRGSLQITA